jgi:retron-type reverse transcriptase
VLALVKAFLRAGIMTEQAGFEDTVTGTPQGGILSPLLANIALSALDQHYARAWAAMGSEWERRKRRARGGATFRLVRYADLCGSPHRSAYAEPRVMPSRGRNPFRAAGIGWECSA